MPDCVDSLVFREGFSTIGEVGSREKLLNWDFRDVRVGDEVNAVGEAET